LPRVEVQCRALGDGWSCDVTVAGATRTTHRVRVSAEEHRRHGAGDINVLVSGAFEFLLAREPNTSILREFAFGDIEHYFPEFASFRGPSAPTARG
jgi:hypothetical protein